MKCLPDSHGGWGYRNIPECIQSRRYALCQYLVANPGLEPGNPEGLSFRGLPISISWLLSSSSLVRGPASFWCIPATLDLISVKNASLTSTTPSVGSFCTTWLENSCVSTITYIAAAVTKADVIKIEVQAYWIITVKPRLYVFNGECLSRHWFTALTAVMLRGHLDKLPEYVFNEPVACRAWIHTKLFLLFQ